MKYILIVNPNGGTKSGPKILKQIKPIFDSYGIELFIIETTFAGISNLSRLKSIIR